MGLKASIEAATKATVLTDCADLQGLVALGELLRQLHTEATNEGAVEVATHSNDAAELADQIVLRQVADVERAFRQLVAAVECCEDASERADAPRREPTDPELLMAWVSACEASIPEIEHLAVKAEKDGFEGETAADIRRRIHTLKGECGVLSLSVAQTLCHEVESAVESTDRPFPIDTVLALCDWMRTLTAALAQDPCAAEPDPTPVLDTMPTSTSIAHDCTDASVTPCADAYESEAPCTTLSASTPSVREELAIAPPSPCEDPFADLLSISYDLRVMMVVESADENLGDFAIEAREHLTNAEAAVLSLETNPQDSEQVNVVFRAFHTIKGVAGFLNLPRVVEVAHAAEFLLDRVRSNKLPFSTHVLELVLASSDLLGQLIGTLLGGEPPRERELKILVRRLEAACAGRVLAAPGQVSSAAATPRAVVSTPSAIAQPTLAASTAEAKPGGNATAMQNETDAAEGRKPHAMVKVDQSVKVSTLRMDSLCNLVGELVIAQLMVVQDPEIETLHDQRLQRNLAHLGKIVRDLQETSMSLRMVTLKATFQKMARLVRDVAAKAGKRIVLEVEGDDVELDRNVVEEIGDPLVHMIRNACDHGIENSEDRVRAGKSDHGTLKLRAYHSGGSIVIEVEDDGRGLQRERIIKKCLEKGLIEGTRNIADIPDSEVYNYVFLPGFSTAEKVTDISGRGVGMDVVRRNIEALRGSVEIHSTPGKGSVFSMRLPLTMAIIDGMVVRVGTQRYVIPTLNIERSFRPTEEQLTVVLGKGEVVNERGRLLPIYRLQRMFNLSEGATEFSNGLLLVLENGKRRACVFVDEILGQQQVVIKALGEPRPQIRGVSGGAILGDGCVALIVDVGGLLDSAVAANTSTVAV